MKRKTAKIALFSMVAVMLLLGCKDAFHDPEWDPNTATYEQDGLSHTVTFSANGGSGTAPSPMKGESGASITLPYPGGLSRGNNYSFGGWNTNSSGTGITFSAGSPFTVPNQDITLYAKWEDLRDGGGTMPPSSPSSGDGGDFSYKDVSGGVEITGYTESAKSVTIPAQLGGKAVVSIGSLAFWNKQLTSVVIPNSVSVIGDSAFTSNQLTSVAIGNNVTTIGNFAFDSNQLTSVTIPNSVMNIGIHAFFLNQLTSVIIGNNVTTIGQAAFSQNQITSVTIGNGVMTIGNTAFAGNLLTSITIPNSVMTIEAGAFSSNQITSVTIGANVSLGDWIFTTEGTDNSFNEVYEANSKSAGTYVRANVTSPWSKL